MQELYDKSNTFFEQAGLFEEFPADLDKTIIHALFTDQDSNINFQHPHMDFDYLTCPKASQKILTTHGQPICLSQKKEAG
jgi:hypothetical protein